MPSGHALGDKSVAGTLQVRIKMREFAENVTLRGTAPNLLLKSE